MNFRRSRHLARNQVRQIGLLMRTIAERLFVAQTANTPGIFLTGFDVKLVGHLLGNHGIAHNLISLFGFSFAISHLLRSSSSFNSFTSAVVTNDRIFPAQWT